MSHPTIDQQITFIYTHDLEQAAEFYENIIGLSLWRDQKSCRIYHLTDQSYLGICQSSADAKGTTSIGQQNNIILTLVSADVDGWYQHLIERDVQFDTAPQFNPKYNIYHCFLRDCDGYLIEIQRFVDP